VYRDDDLLVVEAAGRALCHGGAAMATRRTLPRLRADVLVGVRPRAPHRPDTSGLSSSRAATSGWLRGIRRGGSGREGVRRAGRGRAGPAVGSIDPPAGRPGHGTRAWIPRRGKPATTQYSVTEVLGRAARVRAVPLTAGRTRSACTRVIGTPLLVDPLYGRRGLAPVNPEGRARGPPARTPLHAAELSFTDLRTGERRTFKTPPRRPPPCLEVLRVVAAREAARDREGLASPDRAGTRPGGASARPRRGPDRAADGD
jgi:23S rRNA-/tRNA-specific pseudouridylate synthase